MLYIDLIKIVLTACHLNFFCYHLPTRGRAGVKLGDVMVIVRGERPARWEPQEEGVMSIAASFPSVKKPRYVDLGEKGQTTEGDAC
jgi:hypothetical protein